MPPSNKIVPGGGDSPNNGFAKFLAAKRRVEEREEDAEVERYERSLMKKVRKAREDGPRGPRDGPARLYRCCGGRLCGWCAGPLVLLWLFGAFSGIS